MRKHAQYQDNETGAAQKDLLAVLYFYIQQTNNVGKQGNKKCCADLSSYQLWDIYSSDWISC